MHVIARNCHLNAGALLGIAGGYVGLNCAAVSLAAHGVIHSPWSILMFFTWIGPAVLVLGLLGFQFAARRRLSWPTAVAFLLATGFAVLFNLYIYGRAFAAV